jgi:hypothetical protein
MKRMKKPPRPQVRLVDAEIMEALTGSLAVPVSIVSLATGTGEYAVRQGIQSGAIPSFRVGRKIMVPTSALRQLLGIDDRKSA